MLKHCGGIRRAEIVCTFAFCKCCAPNVIAAQVRFLTSQANQRVGNSPCTGSTPLRYTTRLTVLVTGFDSFTNHGEQHTLSPAQRRVGRCRNGSTHVACHGEKVPFDRWWRVLQDGAYEGVRGFFVHPVSDPYVIAGNATDNGDNIPGLDLTFKLFIVD